MKQIFRYVPFVQNLKIRTTIGFILLVLSITLSVTILGKGRIEVIVPINAFAWFLAVFLTDKYVHKYQRRYFTYLIASHLKAAIIMGISLWIMGWITDIPAVPHDALWTGFIIFICGYPYFYSPMSGYSVQPSLYGAQILTYARYCWQSR